MEIRPYRPDDLEEVICLWYRTWHDTFPGLHHPQTFDKWLARFRDDIATTETVWVAEVDGGIAGFLAMKVNEGYLDQLFVAPEIQHRGVGSALMAQAKAISPTGLTLHTLEQNTKARAFWERHGFHRGRRGTNPINGEPNVEYRWTP